MKVSQSVNNNKTSINCAECQPEDLTDAERDQQLFTDLNLTEAEMNYYINMLSDDREDDTPQTRYDLEVETGNDSLDEDSLQMLGQEEYFNMPQEEVRRGRGESVSQEQQNLYQIR